MSNATHTKRLARMFAEATGRPYAAALSVVKEALAAGTLPRRLDPSGMQAALKTLLAADGQPADAQQASTVPTTVRALWLIREGRVGAGKDPGALEHWMVDLVPAEPVVNLDLHLLDRDGYLAAHLDGTVTLTALGESALDALTPPAPVARPGDRRPYVGDGADGARRSADIDRSEADGLGYDDPRRDEVLASALRWDAQAARLEGSAQQSSEGRFTAPTQPEIDVDISPEWATTPDPLGTLKALLRATLPDGGILHSRYADDDEAYPDGYFYIEDVSTNDDAASADLPDEVLGGEAFERADSLLNEAFERGMLDFDPATQKFYEVEF